MPWRVEHRHGPAAELFHGLEQPAGPTVRALMVSAPTIVLGSSQDEAVVVDRPDGVDVVRRRSGGTAVWLDADMVWLDVTVPAGDPAWHADIHRTAVEVGLRLAAAIGRGAVVHTGRMIATPLSPIMCFGGLGPGEVTIAGRKLVGISQRRTRAAALLQIGIALRWDPAPLLDALGVDDPILRSLAHRAGAGLLEGPVADVPSARAALVDLLTAAVAT